MISMKVKVPTDYLEGMPLEEGLEEIEHIQEWSNTTNEIWSPRKEIEMIKVALKNDHLYNDEELKKLKSRLRDMYTVNKQLKRGNGFGRAS